MAKANKVYLPTIIGGGWVVRVKEAESGTNFLLISESDPSIGMELGYELSPSPMDLYMVDVSWLMLKRVRSPPRQAQSLETCLCFSPATE